MFPSTALKMFIMKLDNPYGSLIYFKLVIQSKFVILISSFMVLRRYVFSFQKGRRCEHLSICVSMYVLNGGLPRSTKTFILQVVFLTSGT